jgi:MFS family permease
VDARVVRHNLLALGLDYSGFLVAMSFASQATILPAFAMHLGASSVAIGAIPAVLTLGWFLPSLFVAHHTEQLARKLPFVLRWTIGERLPMPALAAVAFFLAEPAPDLALATVFGLLLVMTTTGGALMPAWMDIVGRAIPTTLRGRFFGGANVVASAGGLLGSALSAWFLSAVAAPRSYGLCFLAGSVFMALSYLALTTVREPAGAPPSAPVPLRAYLGRMPALLRRDRNLAWFLVARGTGTVATMANGFYTVYALRVWQAPDWQVGVFTALFLAGQLVGNAGLGWLADRAGHRVVLVLGLLALAAGNLVAFGATSADAVGVVLALAGVHQAAMHVSARTILLELAPEAERPTYIGLTNTALAPLTFAAPLAAGLMVDGLGFRPVFVLAGALAAAGAGLLIARVQEPRALARLPG